MIKAKEEETKEQQRYVSCILTRRVQRNENQSQIQIRLKTNDTVFNYLPTVKSSQ